MNSRLLILEDDELTLNFYKKGLDPFFDITYCTNTSQFYDAISNNDYDCMLIDIALKEKLNGLIIIEELRKEIKYRKMPIVAISAFVRKKDEDAAYQAGADVFLKKPIAGQQIIAELKAILKI